MIKFIKKLNHFDVAVGNVIQWFGLITAGSFFGLVFSSLVFGYDIERVTDVHLVALLVFDAILTFIWLIVHVITLLPDRFLLPKREVRSHE